MVSHLLHLWLILITLMVGITFMVVITFMGDTTLVRCYWRISILIIIPDRCCSLIGLICYRSVVVLLDCRHPCFRNLDSTSLLILLR